MSLCRRPLASLKNPLVATRSRKNTSAGGELLHGIREYALSVYGPMTPTLFAEWGIHCCEDFGEIVFNMIRHHQVTQSDSDSPDDFKDGYDFHDAFRKPFLPSAKPAASTKGFAPE